MGIEVLDWSGCYNVRDLGGLATRDGRRTRAGALIRSDAASALTAAGWAALRDHGVRTVIDLTEAHERRADIALRPAGLVTAHAPLDGTDRDFWAPLEANGWWGTALYYPPFLRRYPDRVARAVRAFATAAPGGVLVHCGRGRDRTGLVVLVLLSLAGVNSDEIVADYLASDGPAVMTARAKLGLPDDTGPIPAIYNAAGTTAPETLRDLLTGLDAAELLRHGGLTDVEIGAARDRLVETP